MQEEETLTVRLVLFNTDRRLDYREADDLRDAQHIAMHQVGRMPRLEGCGLFGYAFDSVSGRSVRVLSGATLRELFPEAA